MGRPKKQGDQQILRKIALSPDPVVTASELANQTDYTKDGVLGRLNELEKNGDVDSRKVGARAKIWWLTTQGRQKLN